MRHPLPFLLGAVEISTTHFLPSLIWLLVFVNNSETPVFLFLFSPKDTKTSKKKNRRRLWSKAYLLIFGATNPDLVNRDFIRPPTMNIDPLIFLRVGQQADLGMRFSWFGQLTGG